MGRSTPLTYSGTLGKAYFFPYYLAKDRVGLVWLLLFYFIVLQNPYLFTDPEMFIEANPLVSPLHIVPEWYFLPSYAVLRAQPIKVLGVLLLVGTLLVPALLGLVVAEGVPLTVLTRLAVWWFIANVFLLGWLGQCPVEEPFTTLRVACTSLYFFLLGVVALGSVMSDFLFCSWFPVKKSLYYMDVYKVMWAVVYGL